MASTQPDALSNTTSLPTTTTTAANTTTASDATTEIVTTLETTPATTRSTEAATQPSTDGGSSVGPIVGGCVAGVVLVAVFLVVFLFLRRRMLRRRAKKLRKPPMAPGREQLDPHAELQSDQPPPPDIPDPGTKGLQLYENLDENNTPSEATDPSLDLDGYLKKTNVPNEKRPRKKQKHHRRKEHETTEEAELQPYKNLEFHSKKQGRHVERGISVPEESAPGIPNNLSDGRYVNGKMQSDRQKHGNRGGRVKEVKPGEITTDVPKLDNNDDADELIDYENVSKKVNNKHTLDDLTNYQNVGNSGQVSEADITVSLEPDELYENP